MKPRSEWKQPQRKAWLARGTKPIPKRNETATAKRQARYKKALSSAHWKALRKQVFAEQGGLCVCGQEPMTTLDHLTYFRLGHELREDVQGLGDVCNARETTSKRANWAQPRRGR
jgi:5-methylcytosine-specific restriction endonuclease McrA